MNREWVEVTAIEPKGVWVESLQRSACESCNARSGCGQKTLSTLGRSVSLWIPTTEKLDIGESIMLELPEGGLALSAIMLYGIPLVALALGAIVGQSFGSDWYSVLAGCVSMGIGLSVSRWCAERYQYLWQPTILNRGATTLVSCSSTAEK